MKKGTIVAILSTAAVCVGVLMIYSRSRTVYKFITGVDLPASGS